MGKSFLTAMMSIIMIVSVSGLSGCDYEYDIDPGYIDTINISGFVVVSCNSSPLNDVSIDLYNDTELIITVFTDSNGYFSFGNVASGEYSLVPVCKGYRFTPSEKQVSVAGQDPDQVLFRAEKIETGVYTISGVVTEDSTALEGVALSLMSGDKMLQTTVTDSAGSYLFNGIVDGAYTMVPALSGYHFDTEEQQVTVAGGPVTMDFSAEKMVSLVFVGDMNLGRNVEETVVEEADGDFTFPFAYTGEYLSSFDLTFGNLESIISDQGENTKSYLAFLGLAVSLRAAPEAVNGLTYAGFDVVSMANNHTGDYGQEAMLDCFNRLNNAGISPVGFGMNYDGAHTYVLKDVDETAIAYLAYTNVGMTSDADWYNGYTSEWIALNTGMDEEHPEERPGIAWADDDLFSQFGDLDNMRADIQSAAAAADVVVVSVHFGSEYSDEPNSAQQVLARAAIDAGASLVVGHHPHVIQTIEELGQAVEEYHGGYIAYSLGNFIFDQTTRASTKRGMIVEAYIHDRAVEDVQVRYSQYNDYFQAVLEE